MGLLVSLTNEFKNRLRRKLEINFIDFKRKTSGQIGCKSQPLPRGERWRREEKEKAILLD